MVRHPRLLVVAALVSTAVPAGGALAQTDPSLAAFCGTVGAYMQEIAAQRAAGSPLEGAIDEVAITFDALATSADDLASRRRILQWDRPLAVFAFNLGDLPPATVNELGAAHCVARNGDVRLAPAPAATAAMAAKAVEQHRVQQRDAARAADERRVAEERWAAAQRTAQERRAAEAQAAEARAAEDQRAAQQLAAQQRATEQRRAAEEQVAEAREAAEQREEQQRAADERRTADERERVAAERRAEEERDAAAKRAADERRAAAARRAEESRAAPESLAARDSEPAPNATPEPAVAQTAPERSIWSSLQPFYEFAVAYGGDTIGSIVFANGDEQDIETGNGLTFAGGVIQRINDQFGIKYTGGYKLSFSAASNADVMKSVLPIDVVPYYRLDDHKFGAGLSLHLSPKVDWDWLGPTTNFDNALGLTLEYAWRKFGFSYTDMSYETDDTKLDASHMSFKYSSKF